MVLCTWSAVQAWGAFIAQETAVERGIKWMDGHPVMQAAVGRSIETVDTFPDAGGYSVYIVRFSPAGYLVLNSDDRLPLVVSFSVESAVNLSDTPENAFRAMLLRHVARMEEQLAQPVTRPIEAAAAEGIEAVTELYGPFLETTWNQCNPYNLLCPDDPGGSAYYDERVPVGCTPTAFAQVLQYHRWPLFGRGTHTYTDNAGFTTGSHYADFSDPYSWRDMLTAYDAWNPNPQQAEDAVAELMYELGVVAEADYESSGTSSGILALGRGLGEHFFFESCEWQSSQSSLIPAMDADLRSGYPCVVSIPGHAIVADGLMTDSGTTTYHINYGWGGSNNGWWSADNVAGAALEDGATGLRPRLMALPVSNHVYAAAGEAVELQWILPVRREAEAAALKLYHLEQQPGTWQCDASEIHAGLHAGWEVVPEGRSGDGWFAGPNGPASLILDEVFIPDASASLAFWTYYRLGSATFAVSVSTDNGSSYVELFSGNERYMHSWEQQILSLAPYAGREIRLRFTLSSGSYYPGSGGVWLDDLSISSGHWLAWQPLADPLELGVRRFSSVINPWDECSDFSVFELTTTDAVYAGDWTVTTVNGIGECFYKPVPEYTGNRHHLTSRASIVPGPATRLLIHAKYRLASDAFRVLLSTDRSSFTEVWSAGGTADWSEIAIDLGAYEGQPVYVRFEYEGGSYYSDGGVWINSVRLEEVTHPELEGQPVHYTTVTSPPAGGGSLAAALIDTNGVEHGLSPVFILEADADDGDGMPAEWEAQYGLDPAAHDGALDPDQDGYDNISEYICATVPTNASSCWRLENGPNRLPQFAGHEGRLYTILYRPDLTSGSWTPLAVDIPGTNGPVEIDDFDSAASERRFYRVEVRLAD
jgi:hypothetical protein